MIGNPGQDGVNARREGGALAMGVSVHSVLDKADMLFKLRSERERTLLKRS